jgi:hypothetical protein
VDPDGAHRVAVVETRERIARVDGRHVHWVRTFTGGDRYSLIFYDTRPPPGAAANVVVVVGLGRIVALCYRSSAVYQVYSNIRCLDF